MVSCVPISLHVKHRCCRGSHVPSHMVFSLFALWSSVKPGGLYVIEDLETNYWRSGSNIYGYKLRGTGVGADARHSAVTKMEQISQVLVRHHIGVASGMSVMPGDDSLCSIEWGMNLVVLRRCTDEEMAQNPPVAAEPSFKEEDLKEWLQEARASNPPEVSVANVTPNSEPSGGAPRPGTSFADALSQLGVEGQGWSRRLYQRHYEAWLAPFRFSAVKLVELGSIRSRLDLSIKLWTSYFKAATAVLGVATAGAADGTPRPSIGPMLPVASICRDDDAQETVRKVSEKGPWDIVIDDGSLPMNQALFRLFSLWEAVSPGGLYVIENVAKESWASIARSNASTSLTELRDASLVTKLLQVKQLLVRFDVGNPKMSILPEDGELCSMEWGMNIVVLRKCTTDHSRNHPRGVHRFDAKTWNTWLDQATLTNPNGFKSP